MKDSERRVFIRVLMGRQEYWESYFNRLSSEFNNLSAELKLGLWLDREIHGVLNRKNALVDVAINSSAATDLEQVLWSIDKDYDKKIKQLIEKERIHNGTAYSE